MKRYALTAALALFVAPGSGLFAQKLKAITTVKVDTKLGLFCAAPSPDGKVLAVGAGNNRGGLLQLWAVATGKVTVNRKLPSYIHLLAFSPDGKLLASADGKYQITIWQVATGDRVTTFRGQTESITRLTFSSDGKRLGSAGSKEVKLWDVAREKAIATFKQKNVRYGGAAFSRDLKLLASPNFQEIDLWDLEREKKRTILSEHRGQVGWLAFSVDGKTLVAASNRTVGKHPHRFAGQIKVWDVAKGRERSTIKGRFGHVSPAALSPDGKTLALLQLDDIEADIELKVLDIATGRVLLTHKGEDRSLESLKYLSDGRLLVTEILDKTVKLWELAPRKK